jgi:hypothetical protein
MRESCPATTEGINPHASEAGRFFTMRFKPFWVPSRVAVGLLLPPVEALPTW